MTRNPFGWHYPAGAENDPNAPWNEPDYEAAWDDVRDQAVEQEIEALTDEGLESGTVQWMRHHHEHTKAFDTLMEDLTHETTIACTDQLRTDARSRFLKAMKPWVERYVDEGWSDDQKNDLITRRAQDAADHEDDE